MFISLFFFWLTMIGAMSVIGGGGGSGGDKLLLLLRSVRA